MSDTTEMPSNPLREGAVNPTVNMEIAERIRKELQFNEQQFDGFLGLVTNVLTTRSAMWQKFIDPRRSVDDECGYPKDISNQDVRMYQDLYDREPIANRVVNIFPRECWQVQPDVYETEDVTVETQFETEVKKLSSFLQPEATWHNDSESTALWSYLKRADELSGIGHFGVILFGFNDGMNLQEPVGGAGLRKGLDLDKVNDPAKKSQITSDQMPKGTQGNPGQQAKDGNKDLGKYNPYSTQPGFTGPTMEDINPSNRLSVLHQASAIYNSEGKEFVPTLNTVLSHIEKPADIMERMEIRNEDGTVEYENRPMYDPQHNLQYAPDIDRHLATINLRQVSSEIPPSGIPVGTDAQYVGVQFGPDVIPTEREKNLELTFLRVFPETLVQVVQYESNVLNPRFGKPVRYRITLNDPHEQHSGVGLPLATVHVHWSRVLHVCDNWLNPTSNEIFSAPRMRPVLNCLLDIKKVRGGSAEMYWRGAFPGLSLETHPTLGGEVNINQTTTRNMMESYMNGLQRYLALTGMTAKSLAPQVVDPKAQIEVQTEAICIQLDCPVKKFKGSEEGQLASATDEDEWLDNIRSRHINYLTPKLIAPFFDRLIMLGVLVEPKQGYKVAWPDLTNQTAKEKALIAVGRTKAIAEYIASGMFLLINPVDYFTDIIGMTEMEAKSVLKGMDQAAIQQLKQGMIAKLTMAGAGAGSSGQGSSMVPPIGGLPGSGVAGTPVGTPGGGIGINPPAINPTPSNYTGGPMAASKQSLTRLDK